MIDHSGVLVGVPKAMPPVKLLGAGGQEFQAPSVGVVAISEDVLRVLVINITQNVVAAVIGELQARGALPPDPEPPPEPVDAIAEMKLEAATS